MQEDSFTQIEQLNRAGTPLEVVNKYKRRIAQLYARRKDIDVVVLLSVAAIEYGLDHGRALARRKPKLAYETLSVTKAISYNLAANTWPGWGDPVTIEPFHMRCGLDAARLNLRLAKELNKGELPQSRAHWMLGAQLLANGAKRESIKSFERAERLAAKAGVHDEALLCRGFMLLAERAAARSTRPFAGELRQIAHRLRGMKDGPFYTMQLLTAQRIFTPLRKARR